MQGTQWNGTKSIVTSLGFFPERHATRGRRYEAVFASRTVTITSAAATTPQYFLTDDQVPRGVRPYLMGFKAKVDGATNWATTATVKIQSNDGAVDFITFAVAGMTGNAKLVPGTANVTLEDAFIEELGGVTGKGVKLIGNANGTGSDFKVTAYFLLQTLDQA